MKILGILLLMICSSCVCSDIKIHPDRLRCAYSREFDKCRCSPYNLSTGRRTDEAVDHPADYCDDVSGFKAKDWMVGETGITAIIKYNYQLYCDSCKKD